MSVKMKFSGFNGFNENWFKDSQKELEQAMLEENQKNWKEEENPDDSGWRPRKDKVGKWPLLNKTGKLQKTARVKLNRRGFYAKVEPYGVFHQNGTKNLDRRTLFGVPNSFIVRGQKIICRKILKKRSLPKKQN